MPKRPRLHLGKGIHTPEAVKAYVQSPTRTKSKEVVEIGMWPIVHMVHALEQINEDTHTEEKLESLCNLIRRVAVLIARYQAMTQYRSAYIQRMHHPRYWAYEQFEGNPIQISDNEHVIMINWTWYQTNEFIQLLVVEYERMYLKWRSLCIES